MGKTALSHASWVDEKKLGNAREAGKEAHVPRPLRAQAGEVPVSKTQKRPRRWVQGRRMFWTFGGMSGGGGDFMERICPFERIFFANRFGVALSFWGCLLYSHPNGHQDWSWREAEKRRRRGSRVRRLGLGSSWPQIRCVATVTPGCTGECGAAVLQQMKAPYGEWGA